MESFVYVIFALCLTTCLANPTATTSDSPFTTWAPDPFCPYPSDEIFFYSDPDDCSKYIECYEGVKYVRNCARGLLWDEENLACDYPRNVDCKSRPNPTPDGPVSTEPVTTEAPASETSATTEAPEVSTTPAPLPTSTEEPVVTTFSPAHICDNQADGSYLADPTDCKRFYECVSGEAVPGTCPTGTEWNEKILNCDRPQNVDCPSTRF
ncbi:probable endochitinase [Anoplophora glabripennis]|uniref:Peritrophin n=1 Tax=Anoplophora glabripennis TaxID=217634 RepID=V5I9L7_ANOGL|nr:probable endochitinase [Anoplophora glabripennis]